MTHHNLRYKSFLLIPLLFLFPFENLLSQVTAFPEAEGYGKFASGGRGGRVIFVTNLKDDGPGSFRNAVEQKGARTIVFTISGNIELESELEIKNGDLTIAGQTAPGDGICIKNYQTTVEADNIIIRFIRFRLGDEKQQEADALSIMNSENIIVDHCTLSWGIDEVFSFYDNKNSTMQWCIISEALNDSYHSKGRHGYGGIWGGINASFYYNILAHNSSRNPRFNGARTGTSNYEELVDFRNNVIYNWGENSSYGGEGGMYNLVSNYYKAGPASQDKNRILQPFDDEGKWYIKNNFVYGYPDVSKDNWNGGIQGEYAECNDIKSDSEFGTQQLQTESAEKSYEKVLRFSGALFPARDKVDERIIEEVRNGTAGIGNGIINSQQQVGGWPLLDSAEPQKDSDNDGMPNEWEIKMNLNPNDPNDQKKITSSGYTNLENYLNSLVKINY